MKIHVNSSRTYVVLATSLMLLVSSAPSTNSLMGPASALAGQQFNTKSYREWKFSMISEAEARLRTTKDSMAVKSKVVSTNTTDINLNNEIKNLQNQFDKEKLQLSMAHDLTISDYFVGYLTKQKEIDKAIKEVSSRLTAEEVAELMSAYANNFFSSTPPATKQPPQAEVKSRLSL